MKLLSEFASKEFLWIDCICNTGKQLQKPKGVSQSHQVLPIIDLVNVNNWDIFLWCSS